MSRVLHLALNDVRLTVRDRAAFLWLLAVPVVLMWIFGNFGGGGDARPRLTVVDRDGGWLARAFVERLRSQPVDLVEMTPDEAAAPEAKKVRTLVLPEGFTEGALAGVQQKLSIVPDEGASADFTRAADAHVLRAVVRTLALLVEMGESRREPGAADRFAALAGRPPLVRLEVSKAGTGHPVPSGRAQSVPGILTMTVLMMTVIYGAVFLTLEKRDGTLRRQLAGPVSPARIFAGKVLGRWLVAAIQIVVLLVFGTFAFGVDFGKSPLGMALLLSCYAFSVAAIATLMGAWLASPEQASAVGWLASMVMAALGGCWWPSEVVPRWLWKASHVFPTAWAMDGFHALISFGKGTGAVVLPCAALVGIGAVALAFARASLSRTWRRTDSLS